MLQVRVPSRVSDEELLEALEDFTRELGRPPTGKEMDNEGPYATATYRNHFGTWSAALEKIGYSTSKGRQPQQVSDEDLLEALRTVADRVGHCPTGPEFTDHTDHHHATLIRRFGTMNAARDKAGLETLSKGVGAQRHLSVSSGELLDNLQNLAKELGRTPTSNEMDDIGEYSASSYQREFGSWNSAVEAAGLEVTNIPLAERDDLLDELDRVADKIGGVPRARQMSEHGAFAPDVFAREFGSWVDALRSAGYTVQKRQRNGIPDSELLEGILELAGQLGRAPTFTEMRHDGPFSTGAYSRAFGSWTDALREAGFEPHRQPPVTVSCDQCGNSFGKPRTEVEKSENHFCSRDCFDEWKREVRPNSGEDHYNWKGGRSFDYGSGWTETRREKVRERDGRKCIVCGMESQEHKEMLDSKLHVHHLIPARQFDDPEKRNSMDNLATLCMWCHQKWEGIPLRPQRAD